MIQSDSCLTIIVGPTCKPLHAKSAVPQSEYQLMQLAHRTSEGGPTFQMALFCEVTNHFARKAPPPSLVDQEQPLKFAVEPFSLLLSALSSSHNRLGLNLTPAVEIERDKVPLAAIPDDHVRYLYVVDLPGRLINVYSCGVTREEELASPLRHMQAGLWQDALRYLCMTQEQMPPVLATTSAAFSVHALQKLGWSINHHIDRVGRYAAAAWHESGKSPDLAERTLSTSAYSW